MREIGPKSRVMLDEMGGYYAVAAMPFAVDLAKSQGMYLATVDGERLFDWAGYFGAKLIEHNHPRMYEPDYVKRLVLAANNKVANPDFLTAECVAYYRELYTLAPVSMRGPSLEVYVVNSGAEAVENMMKYLISLHHEKLTERGRTPTRKADGVERREVSRSLEVPAARRFIYFDQAFHGRTVLTLNVTRISDDPTMTKDFHGLMPGNLQVPFPALDTSLSPAQNAERVEKTLSILRRIFRQYGDEIVAVILEPLQGAGGNRAVPAEFLPKLSALCHEHGVQLGFDEVQTAGGLTGTFFAIDAVDLPYPPQAVAAGKKLGNGVVYMQQKMKDRVLDSTWGGSLADMVRFVQEMEIVRSERLLEQVPEKSAYLVEVLTELAHDFPALVHNVRGYGLYQGFSVNDGATKDRLIDDALEHEHLLLIGAGPNTIRLRPHLHVTKNDIASLGAHLRNCLQRLSAS